MRAEVAEQDVEVELVVHGAAPQPQHQHLHQQLLCRTCRSILTS